MRQAAKKFQVLATVTDYTRFCGLPAPAHPLLTLIDLAQTRHLPRPPATTRVVQQLYSVWLKKDFKGRLHYGHQAYDFREGVLGFVAPGQVFSVDETVDTSELSGWMLVFHPDLLRKYPLGQKMGLRVLFLPGVLVAKGRIYTLRGYVSNWTKNYGK